MWTVRTVTAAVLMLAVAAWAQPVQVGMSMHRPEGSAVQRWPVVAGVPFAMGARQDATGLLLLNARGEQQPAQFSVAGRWRDGSVRWAHVFFIAEPGQRYTVTEGTAATAPAMAIDDTDAHLVVGPCTFDRAGGGVPAIVNSALAGGTYYAVDSLGRRSTLKPATIRLEQRGPLHSVVKVEGDYRTDDGQRVAIGRIYYHVYAGFSGVKVSHKIILTENTNKLWFRDIGVELPLALGDKVTATFNVEHDNTAAAQAVKLAAGQTAVMVQDDFPHFASESSHFALTHDGKEVISGGACGDWVDVSNPQRGLAVQLPAFAEQFPKAFRASADRIVVKLWAGEETGQELDFRTAQIVENYFGHDWLPPEVNKKFIDQPNTAQSTARTHDFWLYPHEGALTPELVSGFGATRQPIFAVADADYIADTAAMDAFHSYDPERFPRIEEVIRDYFVRNVILPEKVFPNTGYIAWGRNPYTAQGWVLRDGKWYPTAHRLSRVLEYNLKRCAWVLFARSGDPMYFEWARRNTRFLGDWISSNFDTNLKPLGWFVQGQPWDSPCFWGAYPQEMIDSDTRPHFISEHTTLGYGTSEDVIQYVYDYFFTGDLHSRDSARDYKDAVMKELHGRMDKMLSFAPPYVLLRPIASAMELDPDPALYDFMHEYLQLVVGDGSDVVNNEIRQNYVKSGEIWAGFYHYWVSTRDPLALEPLLRGAQRYYRTNRIELIYRGSGMPQAFAVAYEHTRDPAYIAHLRQAIEDFAKTQVTLRDRGVRLEDVGPDFDKEWGHAGAITMVSPITIGIPVALRVIADATGVSDARVPAAVKPYPTHKTYLYIRKDQPGPARLDLYINNFGDAQVQPALFDAAGRPVDGLKVVAHESHRVGKPHGDADWQWAYNSFYGRYGTLLFWQLSIDAPPGVYRIEAGDQCAMSVLYSEIDKVVQVAPDGVVLEANRPYYSFIVSGEGGRIEMFAHRAVEVFTPAGEPVTLEEIGPARYAFDTSGKPGAWRIQTATDKKVSGYPFTKVESFVRFENAPLVIAMDDPDRLFEVDASALKPARLTELPAIDADQPFIEGRLGQGIALKSSAIVELPQIPPAPVGQGTVEFWFRPFWSSTDLHHAGSSTSMLLQHLLSLDPVLITHDARADERRPDYLQSKLVVQLFKAEKGSVSYPVTMPLESGRWYHVAVTWKTNATADGRDADIEVFLNGRRQSYDDYRGGVPADLKVSDLAAPATSLRFGSAVYYGHAPMPGQVFDEVRISNVIRYTDDFVPPTQPFTPDEHTHVLMHLDGDLSAQVKGVGAANGQIGKASKLR